MIPNDDQLNPSDGRLTRSASEVASEVIRQAILDGRLRPGERLTEAGLARDLRISRTPVREALRALRSDGLVDWAPYRGSSVRKYDSDDLDDMYQLRSLLEGYAARRAAGRIAISDIDRLRESCVRMRSLGEADENNIHEVVRENVFFHKTLLDAAQSQRLTDMIRQVIELPLVVKSYIWYSPNQKRASERAHEELTNALADHDADGAEMIMRKHVDHARGVLLSSMRAAEVESTDEQSARETWTTKDVHRGD